MRRTLLALAVAALALSPGRGAAQIVVERYTPVEGFLRIGPEPGRAVPLTERGHTLLLPERAQGGGGVRGVVVFIDPRRFPSASGTQEPGTVDDEALRQGVAVLHISTGNPLDFLFDEADTHALAVRIQQVLQENGLQDSPVFFAGLSLGGTRALRMAAFLRAHGDRFRLQPAAVAVVDAPLDMLRLWDAERRAAALGFHAAAADEGRWVTYLLETHLGGTPAEARARYVAYSPFVYDAEDGGNAAYLRNVPVRAYHEPDVDWWLENRRKSYYSMNSIDLAALVNQLLILGNRRAELMSTHQRRSGYAQGASPHTWSIVDNAELIRWFLEQAAGSTDDNPVGGPGGSLRG